MAARFGLAIFGRSWNGWNGLGGKARRKLGAAGLAPLAGLGLLSIVVYQLAFARAFPLAEWWNHALLDYAWLTRYELLGQLRFLGALGLLFLLYYLALRRVRSRPSDGPFWLIVGFQAAMGLILAGMYPVAAIDLYDYLLYGRLGVYWGANPLAHPPAEFPGEPMLAYSYWPNEPSVYGPIWQLVSEWITVAVDGRLAEGLFAFKLLAVGASLLTSALIWLTLRRIRPDLAAAGALFYGWNPLQQFETAGNGHNDALMVTFLALALLLLAHGPRLLALPAISAGLLVKITLAPLAPLIALAPLLRREPLAVRLRDVGIGLALSLVLVVGLYAPFWEGRASLPFLDRGNWFTASPPTLLRELFRRWQEYEAAGRSAAALSAAAFAMVAAFLLGRLAAGQLGGDGESWYAAVVRTGFQLFFAYLVLACLWWQPWYLLVLLTFAALSGDAGLGDRANLFCIGGLLSYPVFKYIWAIHQADWQLDYFKIMALSVLAIFSLPLAHLVVDWLRGSVTRRRVERVAAEAR
jgi:hypothetical protein